MTNATPAPAATARKSSPRPRRATCGYCGETVVVPEGKETIKGRLYAGHADCVADGH